jgi:hypothetical protein
MCRAHAIMPNIKLSVRILPCDQIGASVHELATMLSFVLNDVQCCAD